MPEVRSERLRRIEGHRRNRTRPARHATRGEHPRLAHRKPANGGSWNPESRQTVSEDSRMSCCDGNRVATPACSGQGHLGQPARPERRSLIPLSRARTRGPGGREVPTPARTSRRRRWATGRARARPEPFRTVYDERPSQYRVRDFSGHSHERHEQQPRGSSRRTAARPAAMATTVPRPTLTWRSSGTVAVSAEANRPGSGAAGTSRRRAPPTSARGHGSASRAGRRAFPYRAPSVKQSRTIRVSPLCRPGASTNT